MPSIRYSDPLASTNSQDELLGYMEQFHLQSNGAYFVTRKFLQHGQSSAANWDLLSQKGDKIGEGISFGRYDQNGLLVETSAFYELA